MNKDIIQGNWTEVKGKLRKQWGKLTDDEVSKMRGTHEELSGYLQKTYGYQKDEAESKIKEFTDENDWK